MRPQNRKDWILWGALGCTLVGTAHAEYTLATATQVHWLVAASVPGALDLYVIRALQKHRDVLPAVLVMVAANVASHLVTAGVLPVHWALISAVGALAPVLLWRVHYLWGVPARVPAYAQAEVQAGTEDPDWDVTYLPAEWTEGYASGAVSAPGTGSVPVYPSAGVHPGTPANETVPDAPDAYLPLWPPVPPPLPPGYTADTSAGLIRYEQVQAADRERLPMFEAYLLTCQEEGSTPTIRGTKEAIGCSQTVAKRYMGYAGYPTEVQAGTGEVQR